MPVEQVNVALEGGAILPIVENQKDSRFDIYTSFMVILPANGKVVVDTGVHIYLPRGSYGRIEPNEELRAKGIISEGYHDSLNEDSIKVTLYNQTELPYFFDPGDKIAKFVILDCHGPAFNVVDYE